MSESTLQPNRWYWIRRADGSLAPYRFHQLGAKPVRGQRTAEFFVGSMIQNWPLSSVVGEAQMPTSASRTDV